MPSAYLCVRTRVGPVASLTTLETLACCQQVYLGMTAYLNLLLLLDLPRLLARRLENLTPRLGNLTLLSRPGDSRAPSAPRRS